jgi:hypothetical protein
MSILPMLQAAAGYTRDYTGAWALMGAGIGAGLSAIGAVCYRPHRWPSVQRSRVNQKPVVRS